MTLTAEVSGRVATGVLLGCAGFQVALAAGAPWGAAAYGGAHPGRLPDRLRMISAAAVPLYVGMAGVTSGAIGSDRVRTVATRVGAMYLAVGVPVNLASPSLPERVIWPVVGTVGAFTLWHAVPSDRRRGRRYT